MKISLAIAIIALSLLTASWINRGAPQTSQSGQAKCCDIVKAALEASRNIKPGMTRRQVETLFREDGGVQFPDEANYVYRDCAYIKVRIWFKQKKKTVDSSPDDAVVKISRPFIDYPTMD